MNTPSAPPTEASPPGRRRNHGLKENTLGVPSIFFYIIAAVIGGFALLVLPVFRFIRYLAREPRLDRHRPRAVAVTLGLVGALAAFLAFFPWPHHTVAPGVLQTREQARVYTAADGYLAEFIARSGSPVKTGDLLVRMENPELELRLSAAEARVRQVRLQENVALQEGGASLLVLRRLRETAEAELADLRRSHRDLAIRAPLDGLWVSPRAGEMAGELAPRGRQLGIIIQPPEFEFVAVVAQDDSARLFSHPDPVAEIRLPGQAGLPLDVARIQLVPGRQNYLPTAALGWSAGGPVKVQPDDPDGLRTAEPYFKAIVRVGVPGETALLHGQTGLIRFTTGTEPLLQQGWRRFRLLLQQRYQLKAPGPPP